MVDTFAYHARILYGGNMTSLHKNNSVNQYHSLGVVEANRSYFSNPTESNLSYILICAE